MVLQNTPDLGLLFAYYSVRIVNTDNPSFTVEHKNPIFVSFSRFPFFFSNWPSLPRSLLRSIFFPHTDMSRSPLLVACQRARTYNERTVRASDVQQCSRPTRGSVRRKNPNYSETPPGKRIRSRGAPDKPNPRSPRSLRFITLFGFRPSSPVRVARSRRRRASRGSHFDKFDHNIIYLGQERLTAFATSVRKRA